MLSPWVSCDGQENCRWTLALPFPEPVVAGHGDLGRPRSNAADAAQSNAAEPHLPVDALQCTAIQGLAESHPRVMRGAA